MEHLQLRRKKDELVPGKVGRVLRKISFMLQQGKEKTWTDQEYEHKKWHNSYTKAL